MTGFTLGQPYGHGRSFQQSIVPGVTPWAPATVTGASYSLRLQLADFWRLVGVTWTLSTDSTVGNRYVTVEYPDGQGVSMVADAASVLVTPSTTAQRFIGSVHRGNSEWNTGTDVLFPLSGLWLEIGRTVTINIANVGSGDKLTKVRFTFDRTPVAGDGSEAIREYALAMRLEQELGG
jgi:hypothetical protein